MPRITPAPRRQGGSSIRSPAAACCSPRARSGACSAAPWRPPSRPSPFEILLPAWIPTPGDVARWRFRRRWLGLIGEIIDARQAKGGSGSGRDLLDLMASDPETGKPVSRRKLADQVATMIAAGHATTAVALFWAFYLLAETPAVQER